MRLNCSCCLDLLTPSAKLSSLPCGHVFHTDCLSRWFESNKNSSQTSCPQCRSKCSRRDFRRLFLTQAIDTSLSQLEDDPYALQNKIDSLKFQVRCEEIDKKKISEERDGLMTKNIALKEECCERERKISDLRQEIHDLKTQIRFERANQLSCQKLKEQLTDMQEKLRLYETIDVVVNGSMAEVNNRLHETGDYSKQSRDHAIIVASMKKEMNAQRDDRRQLVAELKAWKAKYSESMEKNKEASRIAKTLSDENQTLASDLRHCEEERDDLKKKLSAVQESIDSPSGDVRASVINRMLTEHPLPQFPKLIDSDTDSEVVEVKNDGVFPNSPFLKTKSCSLVGLNKRKKSPCKESTNFNHLNIMKKTRLGSQVSQGSQASQVNQSQQVHSGNLYYNGLGGHSKLEEFPQRIKIGKRPKGVSRPRNTSKTNTDKKQATLDDLFNLASP